MPKEFGRKGYYGDVSSYNVKNMQLDPTNPENTEPAGFDAATRSIMPDEQVTRLHLLRHGEVEQMEQRVVRGQLDVNLSAHGRKQSTTLANWFCESEPKPDVIWSSDLTRCQFLAEQIAKLSGAELKLDARLREQDMGDWQGKTWGAISETDGAAVTAYWDDYLKARPTGGETYLELHERVQAWWREKHDPGANALIVIVTHVGVVRSFQCSQLGIDPCQALRFAPPVASHTSFLISEAGAVQTAFGERPRWARDGK